MDWEDYSLPRVDHSEKQKISELFVGRTVAKVDEDRLRLDDGTELRIVANEGCGGCSSGWYELKALNGCENVITRAEVVDAKKDPKNEYGDERIYTLFVYADNQKINLATIEGYDGNGYYGTGFEIVVKKAVA